MKIAPIKLLKIGLTSLLGVVSLSLLAFLLVRWVPINWVNQQLAQRTGPSLPNSLQVEALSLDYAGGLRIVAGGVTVGKQARVEKIVADISIRALLSGQLTINELTLVNAQLDIPLWQQWQQQRPRSPNPTAGGLVLTQLHLDGLKLAPWGDLLGVIDGDIKFDDRQQLVAAQLELFGLQVEVVPSGEGYRLSAQADQWSALPGMRLAQTVLDAEWQPLPDHAEGSLQTRLTFTGATVAGLPFLFDAGSATIEFERRQIIVTALELGALGGHLQGTGSGELVDGEGPLLALSLDLELAGLQLAPIAESFALSPLAGRVAATGKLNFSRQQNGLVWSLDGDASLRDFSSDPMGVKLSELNSPFKLRANGVQFSALQVRGYGGELQGDVDLKWSPLLTIQSRGLADRLQLSSLMSDLQLQPIRGLLDAEWALGWRAGGSSEFGNSILAGLDLTGSWEAYDGFFPGIDLKAASSLTASRSATDQEPGTDPDGGSGQGTAFDTAASDLKIANGEFYLSNIEIKSAVLAASGEVVVGTNGGLRGELQVGGNEATGLIRVPVNVSGNFREPTLRPTKSSVFGGAVGSAILGPGLGTAVGVKVGEGLNNLRKKLIGAD